jgi:hypothetical protein
MDLYYNNCVLEPLARELGTNTFKNLILLLVYSSFLLFITSI